MCMLTVSCWLSKIESKLSESPSCVLQAVADQGVVHFDLKCDNIFMQPLPGVSEQEFWSPLDDQPPFEVILGDFGDSHDSRHTGNQPSSMCAFAYLQKLYSNGLALHHSAVPQSTDTHFDGDSGG